MINHILVPLDGSALAEGVLPHVLAIAPATKARVTLIHVLEHSEHRNGSQPIDPVGWHMQKQEIQAYLEKLVKEMQAEGLDVSHTIVEGKSAESIIEFAHSNKVDLIALCTHGRTGLSGWNVSSVVQKVLLRSYRSILLARAYATEGLSQVQYKRLFVASDCSKRGEYIFPFAIAMSQYHQSRLLLGTIIEKPQIVQRMPLSEEESSLLKQFTDLNQRAVTRYHEEINTQLSLKGIDIETDVRVADHVISALHDMIHEARPDLVMVMAHGETGERRWPYGSITTSLIAHGDVPLMIIQDLSENEIQPTPAEQAIGEIRGH